MYKYRQTGIFPHSCTATIGMRQLAILVTILCAAQLVTSAFTAQKSGLLEKRRQYFGASEFLKALKDKRRILIPSDRSLDVKKETNPCSGSGICWCVNGEMENTCEAFEVSKCLPNPCQNGGTCKENRTYGYFFCDCPSSYTGFKCERETGK